MLPTCPTTGRPIWRGLPVPWVTRWTGEIVDDEPLHCAVFDGRVHLAVGGDPARNPRGVRAAFAAQRDELGLLWIPDRDAPGTGEPQFAQIHGTRQRACMLEGRCQVCGRHFGKRPVTFLESKPMHGADSATADSAYSTMTPPTCRTCVGVAAGKCPSLRRVPRDKLVLVTAHAFRPYAVQADVYGPGKTGIRLIADGQRFLLDDPDLSRAVAKQLCVLITDYTEEPVGPAPELTEAGS